MVTSTHASFEFLFQTSSEHLKEDAKNQEGAVLDWLGITLPYISVFTRTFNHSLVFCYMQVVHSQGQEPMRFMAHTFNHFTLTYRSEHHLPPIHLHRQDIANVKSATSSRKGRSEGVLCYYAGRLERVNVFPVVFCNQLGIRHRVFRHVHPCCFPSRDITHRFFDMFSIGSVVAAD